MRLDDRRLVRLHRRNQPIASARQGLDESRGLGRVPKRFAQPLYRRVHSVLEVDECVALPEPLTQFLASDQLAGALHQAFEHLEGLLLKVHAQAGLSQLAHAKVQLERAKPHHVTAWNGCLTHVPPLRWSILLRRAQCSAAPSGSFHCTYRGVLTGHLHVTLVSPARH